MSFNICRGTLGSLAIPTMGFNKRKMEDTRRQEAETNRDAYARAC